MNNIVVDTNPLLYIYHNVSNVGRNYAALLGELAKKNSLFIPKIVYGELSLAFEDEKELNEFLNDTGIIIGEMTPQSYGIAAKRWEMYNQRRVITCAKCGKKIAKLICANCNATIKIRQHILGDFLVGAYALQMKGGGLVTSDKGYFSTYFPELNIISACHEARGQSLNYEIRTGRDF